MARGAQFCRATYKTAVPILLRMRQSYSASQFTNFRVDPAPNTRVRLRGPARHEGCLTRSGVVPLCRIRFVLYSEAEAYRRYLLAITEGLI